MLEKLAIGRLRRAPGINTGHLHPYPKRTRKPSKGLSRG